MMIDHDRYLHGLAHRLTNRWEASLWLKGRQLYLGGFNSEADAARAYDIVALSCKGLNVATNFPAATYTAELAELASSSCSQVCFITKRISWGTSPFLSSNE